MARPKGLGCVLVCFLVANYTAILTTSFSNIFSQAVCGKVLEMTDKIKQCGNCEFWDKDRA